MLIRFFVICLFLSLNLNLKAQDSFAKTVKEYFRVNPFQGSFSSFVNALSTDPALMNKQTLKQTDTTGYLIRGEYQLFNPFSINASKVDLLFYESLFEFSGKKLFNFYTYQITAYFPDNELTKKKILKDYKKIIKKLRFQMYNVKSSSLKGYNGIVDGDVTTLTNNTFPLVPAVVSWQTMPKREQIAITLIARIRQENNMAVPANTFLNFYNVDGSSVSDESSNSF